MQSKDKKSDSTSEELNERSANKLLEMLLYNINQNVSGSINSLMKSSESLDAEHRIQITNLKESIGRMELLLNSALKSRASIGGGDLSNAEPDVIQRIQVEQVLRTLATTTSAKDIEEFFRYCVKTLAQLYGCKFAFIGLLKDNREEVVTQAVWAGDGYAENFEYHLKGTPCAEIINLEKELIPTNASELYAEDELLVSMNIDSYFGAPIITKEKGVIGLVSVMDVKPMELSEWTAPVLGVFASRLALELQRKIAVDELQTLNDSLEEKIEERTRELEASNRELAAFSYSVSHDLRAPVRSINSFMQMFYEDYKGQIPDSAFETLDRVKRAGKKLDTLIEDMLGLAKVSRADMLRQKININEIVVNEIQLLREQYPGRKVEVKVHDNLQTWGDKGLLTILFHNLLSNAWKYTSKNENAVIEIGKKEDTDKGAVFFVKDNGVGFDVAYAEKLFIPFQRLHTEEEFEGNGIGLATILRVINRHTGEIWPESEVGRGATFYFTFGNQLPIKRKNY